MELETMEKVHMHSQKIMNVFFETKIFEPQKVIEAVKAAANDTPINFGSILIQLLAAVFVGERQDHRARAEALLEYMAGIKATGVGGNLC